MKIIIFKTAPIWKPFRIKRFAKSKTLTNLPSTEKSSKKTSPPTFWKLLGHPGKPRRKNYIPVFRAGGHSDHRSNDLIDQMAISPWGPIGPQESPNRGFWDPSCYIPNNCVLAQSFHAPAIPCWAQGSLVLGTSLAQFILFIAAWDQLGLLGTRLVHSGGDLHLTEVIGASGLLFWC